MEVKLMKRIEERLIDEKKRLDAVTVPEDLEARLRTALNNTPKRTKRRAPIWVIAAIALLFMSIAGYNYKAFAYYGKKIFGFDEVMTDTLNELNNDGMGQIIEKQTKLEDGTDFIINGIITDANQLILYYTLINPNGIDEHTRMSFSLSKVTGFLTNSYAEFGSSLMNDDQTELKGTMSFEPVNPFSKKLTLHYDQQLENSQMIERSISFSYHPNEALQTEMKQSLKKKFTVDKGTVTFNSITATPASTVIDGTLNVENFDRVESALHGIELIANGRPVQLMGSGNQSSLKGQEFEVRYDALPKQLDSLQLVINEFVGYEKLEENIALATIKNEPIPSESKELWVKDVSTTVQGVEITIATENDVMLDRVSIKTHNEVIPLKTTVNQTHTELEDGRIMKERTLLFDTTEEPEYLLIQGMHYMKQYNHTLEIQVD